MSFLTSTKYHIIKYLNMKLTILFAFFSLSTFFLSAQNSEIIRKTLTAKRISEIVKIDGKLSEHAWEGAEFAVDFTEMTPNNGAKEPENLKSRVRVLYDNSGLYIGAELFDNHADSILTQLTERDGESVADFFIVAVNPYNDGRQEFDFGVSAAGVQTDAINTLDNGYDAGLDAVWESDISINADGWTVEMKIPFSALRFPKAQVSEWAINFGRDVKRYKTTHTWNFVDTNHSNGMLFAGILLGLENIEPPTRFFLTPYSSAYLNSYNGETHSKLKAGADLKWGISDNFTLDAILIPDFGQTAFDEVQYELGPFEQQFAERRSFFTEGTDLFNKGALLYTRRIGEIYDEMPNLNANESITSEQPANTNLINAVKISGRTADGWGIGVMNAVTDKIDLEITNSENDSKRTETQTPYTNFNVIALDKRYKNNSSVSLVNTNVTRFGDFRDANVTALISDNYLLKQSYNIVNDVKISQIFSDTKKQGISLGSVFSKVKGKNRFGANFRYISKDFDKNDFGYNYYVNYQQYGLNYTYRILQTTKRFNTMNISANTVFQLHNETHKPETASLNFNFNSQNKKSDYYGFRFEVNPFKTYDHYEPRTPGRYMQNYGSSYFWIGLSPNYNRKFLVDFFPFVSFSEKKGMWKYGANVAPRWRISDKLSFLPVFDFSQFYNFFGYVDTQNSEIIIGQRNQISTESNIRTQYSVNPHASFALNLRHYWTTVDYSEFFTLQADGTYETPATYTTNADFSYNNWNADLSFSWWFAPGSQLTVLYRHSLSSYSDSYDADLAKNLQFMFNEPQSHTLSLRMNLFLDYNRVSDFVRNRNMRK